MESQQVPLDLATHYFDGATDMDFLDRYLADVQQQQLLKEQQQPTQAVVQSGTFYPHILNCILCLFVFGIN